MIRKNKAKIVVSSLATFFLVVLYVLIFSFSEQDGETSGSLSHLISEKCVAILNNLSGKRWSEIFMESMVDYFENPIRKLAHFGEYAVMGVLLFCIWYPWIGFGGFCEKAVRTIRFWKRIPKLFRIILPWVFASAAFDEIHQLFIPGRCGNFWDVLLDFSGGCFGVLCCVVVCNQINKRKNLKTKVCKKTSK